VRRKVDGRPRHEPALDPTWNSRLLEDVARRLRAMSYVSYESRSALVRSMMVFAVAGKKQRRAVWGSNAVISLRIP